MDVPALAMIDDIMGMAVCGDQSIELNAIINSKMENKKLKLSKGLSIYNIKLNLVISDPPLPPC